MLNTTQTTKKRSRSSSPQAVLPLILPVVPKRKAAHRSGKTWSLHHGDSLQLLEQFEPESFDMIFADPPYFLSNGGMTCQNGQMVAVDKGKWDESKGIAVDHEFCLTWLAKCQRLLKPTGTLWVSGTQHVIFNVGFALQTLGYKILNTITWYKPNASPHLACRYFTHSTELIIWASPKPTTPLLHKFHYAKMKAENGGKQMRDVWALPKTGEEELDADGQGRMWSMLTPLKIEKQFGKHPTQKPVTLLKRIIEASTSPGDKVLDPFCGSGTTGVAAVTLGRHFVGIEAEKKYLDVAQKRIEAQI